MNEIRIIPKPDTISYDAICEVIDEIHHAEAFDYNTSGMNGVQMQQRIGTEGMCFVALDGDRVAGTITICIEKINQWYYHGIVGRIRFMGVLPEYRGRKLGTKLIEAGLRYARDMGIGAVIFATAAVNQKAISMYQKAGCQYVDFLHFKNLGHYSVMGIYWLDAHPYSNLYCKLRFALKKSYVKIRFTPNGRKRLL